MMQHCVACIVPLCPGHTALGESVPPFRRAPRVKTSSRRPARGRGTPTGSGHAHNERRVRAAREVAQDVYGLPADDDALGESQTFGDWRERS